MENQDQVSHSSNIKDSNISIPISPLSNNSHKNKPNLLIGILLVCVFVLLGLLIWVYLNQNNKTNNVTDLNTSSLASLSLSNSASIASNSSVSNIIFTAPDYNLMDDYFYYRSGDTDMYKYNLATKETKLLFKYNKPDGTSSAHLGDSGPFVSYNQKYIVAVDNNEVVLNDILNNTSKKIELPNTILGKRDILLKGFSINSDQILITLNCWKNHGDFPDYVDCDSSFYKNTGFYVYNLSTSKVNRLNIANDYQYDQLIGWAPYSNDKFLLTAETRNTDSVLMQVDLVEINVTNSLKVIKKSLKTSRPSTGSGFIQVQDLDSNGNLLYVDLLKNGNSYVPHLYLNDKQILEETNFTDIQSVRFVKNIQNLVIYYSNSGEKAIMKTFDISKSKIILTHTFDSKYIRLYGNKYIYLSPNVSGKFNLINYTTQEIELILDHTPKVAEY